MRLTLRLPMVALLAATLGGADDPAAAPQVSGTPSYILVGTPADLDALLGRLGRPDFILKSGADAAAPLDRPPAAPVVESVAVVGEVRDELATLEVGLVVHAEGSGPQWVPIRLDGVSPSSVVGRGQDRAVRAAKEGGWSVEVEGAGRHELQVKFVVPTRPTAEGGRLELAIPEAPSTRVDIAVATPIEGAQAGLDSLVVEPPTGDRPSRFRGLLAPRRRLELTWRSKGAADSSQAPALLVQGTLAADVDRGSFRVASTWRVSSERGLARSLVLRLDPADEIVGLELDLVPVVPSTRREGPFSELTIPLREPLRPTKPRRLDLVTRRALAAAPPLSTAYRGVEFVGAIAQSGVLAIAKSEDLWVGGTAGRGIRQVDPRENLPPTLAARPSTALAYRFVEQPFDLALRVDPTTPIVRVEPRSTVVVGDEIARIDVCLDYQVTQGRVFEVGVELPAGLALTGVGPEATVAGSTVRVDGAGRRLVVQLTPRARDEGNFRLRLSGRQPVAEGPTAAVGLPRAEGIGGSDGLLSVLTRRGVAIELGEGLVAARFATAAGVVPADWPTEVASASTPQALWLRLEGSPDALPIRRTARPAAIWHQSTVAATLGNGRAEVRQETTLRVTEGTIAELEVTVPAAASGRWEALGPGIAAVLPVADLPGVASRHRLRLARPISGTTTLRFRVDLPLPEPAPGVESVEMLVPLIGLAEGASGPASATIQADPRLGVEAVASPGWVAVPAAAAEAAVAFRSTGREEPQTLPVRVSRPEVVRLPTTILSHLDLRTDLGVGGDARVRAALRVAGPIGSIAVDLPAGAEWVGVSVDGAAVGQTLISTTSPGRRIVLPKRDGREDREVVVDYRLPAGAGAARWEPPTVIDGIVMEARWEVRVPWSQVVVGIPGGWEDGNEWYWDKYMWKRRPLAGRVGDRGADHGYAFVRPGGAAALRPLLFSKAGLVGVCSGSVLAIGLPLVLWRWRGRGLVVAALGALGATLAAFEPGALVAIAQASALGLVLIGLAAGSLRLVERRRPRAVPAARPAFEVVRDDTPGRGPSGAGSDESTFIRPRAGTTVEHARRAAPVDP